MKQLITDKWRPKSWTKTALKKDGYTNEQRIRLGEAFIKNKKGQELTNPGQAYIEFFRKSETPRDAKAKPDNSKELIKTRAQDLKNKAEDGAERAQEAKQQEGIMTQKQAIKAFNDLRNNSRQENEMLSKKDREEVLKSIENMSDEEKEDFNKRVREAFNKPIQKTNKPKLCMCCYCRNKRCFG